MMTTTEIGEMNIFYIRGAPLKMIESQHESKIEQLNQKFL